MILVLWQRWREQGNLKWLLLLASLLLLDILVGTWIIEQELELLRSVMR